MKNNEQKYYIENFGSFTPLGDKELNDLCTYEISLVQVPALLFLHDEFIYNGETLLVSHQELKAILQSSLKNAIN